MALLTHNAYCFQKLYKRNCECDLSAPPSFTANHTHLPNHYPTTKKKKFTNIQEPESDL